MKIYIEILLLVIIVVVLFYLSFGFVKTLFAPTTRQSLQNQICFGDHCFFVELAKTEAERERGLMNREELGKDKGMFFLFDKEGIYPFWMKNTLIPLDIIWIGSENKIVFIGHNVQPCKSLICPTTNPQIKAKYVLEINGGLSAEMGIKLGDTADIKN
jgi:uncharacterized membrane protein (UPF0127 family)